MPEGEVSQSEWNLSQYKISLIGELMQSATLKYIRHKNYDSFRTWKSIRMLISNRLSEEELIDCKKLERKSLKYGRFKKDPDKASFSIREGVMGILCEEYSEKVNILLKKYGFDIQDKQESSLF